MSDYDKQEFERAMESVAPFEGTSGSSARRIMNRDGSLNFSRRTNAWIDKLKYQTLLTMPWSRFFFVLGAVYAMSTIAFAGLYVLCGPAALASNGPGSSLSAVWRSFFFSVQTLSTIGYGALVPAAMTANLLVAIESLYGVLAYALITGLFFARFSRIRARIRFSHIAVVGTQEHKKFLWIRVTNLSSNEIVELNGRVLYSYLVGPQTNAVRKFEPLKVEPHSIAFLPLVWTMQHSIDTDSPLFSTDAAKMDQANGEILVLVTGTDESSGQPVHARTSYTSDEVVFDAVYGNTYERDESGRVTAIDMDRFDVYEAQSEPSLSKPLS